MTVQTAPPAAPAKPGIKERLAPWTQQFLSLGALIILFIGFSVLSSNFLTFGNVISWLFSTVVIGTLALGTTFVIISAGIDLSLGTGMSLCAVMSGMFLQHWHFPLVLGVLCAVAFGGVIGLINGVNIAIFKIPPFIATLAMMMVAEGLALVISHSSPIYFTKTPTYTDISTGHLIPGLEIPNAVLIFAAVAAICAFLLNKTILGRYSFALGSNEEATRLSGVDARKWRIWIYVLGGLFIGLAGVLISARLASAQPSLGMGYELQAIAAVVIGGTSLFGGKGSIVGTVVGALIMSLVNNGLQIMNVPQEWQNVVLGGVILIAVSLDTLRRKRASQ